MVTEQPLFITRGQYLSILRPPVERGRSKHVLEKDMGAVNGTSLQRPLRLAGGMDPGDTVPLPQARFFKDLCLPDVYAPQSRQGPRVSRGTGKTQVCS